jgi:hypothetical protein
MYETKLEELIYSFVSFILEVLGHIIDFSVTVALIYLTFYLFCRYLVCQNDKKEWERFTGDLRSGVKDLAEAFRNMGPAVKESAKVWAKEVMDDLLDL